LPNNSFSALQAQIIAALKDREKAVKPVVLAFFCEECAYTMLDTAGFTRRGYPANILPISVPCLSNVSTRHLVRALDSGCDGLMFIGCPEDRCHFKKGTDRAEKQVEQLSSILSYLKFPGKVCIVKVAGTMVDDFIKKSWSFVRSLGG